MMDSFSFPARVRRGMVAASACLAMLGTGIGLAGQAQAAPAPKPTVSAQFRAVSCVRPTWCMAVGYTFGGSRSAKDLAEIWNGKFWRLVATPTGAGLASVSCASTRYCLAFGIPPESAGHVGKAAALRWNGSKWLEIAAPQNPQYTQVQCASKIQCITEQARKSSVESWNGKQWTNTQLCRGSQHCAATAACASESLCMAVGSGEDDFNNSEAMAEVWNGKQWANAWINGQQGPESSLEFVSCLGQLCLAVGNPDVYEWNNATKAWQDVSPSGFPVTGVAMSCGSTTNCMLIRGQLGNAWWNDGTWKYTQFAPTAKSSDYLSVGCAGKSCVAVGFKSAGEKARPIAEFWDGTAWKVTTAPKVPAR